MAKKSTYWIYGDLFTKLGVGLISGIMVAYYVNLGFGKLLDIFMYLFVLGLGTFFLGTGIVCLLQSGFLKKFDD
jgi:hypothetical protein